MSLSDATYSILLDRSPSEFVLKGGSRAPTATAQPPTPAPATPEIDLDALRREAFTAGENAGRRAMMETTAARQARWDHLNTALEQYQDNLECALFEGMLDLSIQVAELILRRNLPDTDMIRSIVTEIIGRVTDMERVQVRLHPSELDELREAVTEGKLGATGRLELVPDASLTPGDVMVENGFGCFDARLSERLNLLRTELVKRWRKTDADPNQTAT